MTPTTPARALLADDHALVRAGLRQLLEQTGQVTIVAEADDGLPVPDLVAAHQVALAVLDISMPHLSGLDLLPILRRRFPDLKIMMLSMHTDAEYVREALRRGANGFVAKDTRPETLRLALAQVVIVLKDAFQTVTGKELPVEDVGTVEDLAQQMLTKADLKKGSTRSLLTPSGKVPGTGLPPSPSSGSDATSMPGPSRLPTAMAATRSLPASLRLWLTSPSIVVASQWLASLKAWPV